MTDFWLGPDAYSGWNRTNVFMELLYPDNAISKTATYDAAEWVPIRVMWGNVGGNGAFGISITAPDGTEIVGSDMASSQYLVQYSCDQINYPYPQYQPWNQET
jgi:hypothetical protein